jgi:hypothetical protein
MTLMGCDMAMMAKEVVPGKKEQNRNHKEVAGAESTGFRTE